MPRPVSILDLRFDWPRLRLPIFFIVDDPAPCLNLAYYEQYFDEPPPPPLFSLDDSGLVLISETFGKQLAPGLRLGYMTGVPEAMKALDAVREDLGVNQLVEHFF